MVTMCYCFELRCTFTRYVHSWVGASGDVSQLSLAGGREVGGRPARRARGAGLLDCCTTTTWKRPLCIICIAQKLSTNTKWLGHRWYYMYISYLCDEHTMKVFIYFSSYILLALYIIIFEKCVVSLTCLIGIFELFLSDYKGLDNYMHRFNVTQEVHETSQ